MAGVAATSAVSAYTTQSSRTIASAAAVMMASRSSPNNGGVLLSGASAEFVKVVEPTINSVSNNIGELSLDENQRLKVEVLVSNNHCSFSMVEFTNNVSSSL